MNIFMFLATLANNIISYTIATILRKGGRTQIARHNLNVFEGGGFVKCWQTFIIFNRFLFAKFHFSRSRHSLRDFICFL